MNGTFGFIGFSIIMSILSRIFGWKGSTYTGGRHWGGGGFFGGGSGGWGGGSSSGGFGGFSGGGGSFKIEKDSAFIFESAILHS